MTSWAIHSRNRQSHKMGWLPRQLVRQPLIVGRAVAKVDGGRHETRSDLEQLTVAQLKPLLKERGLPVSGRKAELISRLLDLEDGEEEEEVMVRDEKDAETLQHEADSASGLSKSGSHTTDAEEHKEPAWVKTSKRLPPDNGEWMSTRAWLDAVPGLPLPPPPGMTLADLAKKEVSILDYVRRRSARGDLDAVLQSIQRFAKEHQWLKVAGGGKSMLLQGSLKPGDRIVELGTYVGYSSMVFARRKRDIGGGGIVTSCEVDAAVAQVARAMHAWAGAHEEIVVRVGRGADWLATGLLGEMDLLVLDHRGTVYHEDLRDAESSLATGARILADNVLHPGAPLFLSFVKDRYSVTLHEVNEYLQKDLEDWIVIGGPLPDPRPPPPTSTPPELRRWSAEVDAICWRSMQGPVNWTDFQNRIGPGLRTWCAENGL